MTGDKSPDEVTRVFTVQTLVCRNPACDNYKQVVQTVETQIYPDEKSESVVVPTETAAEPAAETTATTE